MSRRSNGARRQVAIVEKVEDLVDPEDEEVELYLLDKLEAECQEARDKLFAARLRLGL